MRTAGGALLGALLLFAAAPASAQRAEPSDLEWKGEVIASNGADRTVRFTLTNLGPGAADVRYPGVGGNLKVGFEVFFRPEGFEIVSEPPSCRRRTGGDTAIYCNAGDYLTAGQAVSLDFVLRVLAPNVKLLHGFSNVQVGEEETFYDPDFNNNAGEVRLSDPVPPPAQRPGPQPKPKPKQPLLARCDIYRVKPGMKLSVPRERGLLVNDQVSGSGRTIDISRLSFRKATHPFKVDAAGAFTIKTLRTDRKLTFSYVIDTARSNPSKAAKVIVFVQNRKLTARQRSACPS